MSSTADTAVAYPVQTRGERIADLVMHCTGILLGIVGGVLLITFAALNSDGITIAAVSIYAGAIVASFVASIFYHFPPWEDARETFRRIDHAAIYLKIAGTYTPLVALIGSAFSWSVLAVVWTLALTGAAARLFFWSDVGRLNTILYLVLGWLSLLLLWPIAQTLPAGGTALVLCGGVLYTIGAALFSLTQLRFHNAIWHFFVICGSGCFFAVITWCALAYG